ENRCACTETRPVGAHDSRAKAGFAGEKNWDRDLSESIIQRREAITPGAGALTPATEFLAGRGKIKNERLSRLPSPVPVRGTTIGLRQPMHSRATIGGHGGPPN